ncbi:hypothetical protein DFR50_11536 [Roseiarcus fermentans]|uniref:Lipoprotein n=1 Tax=Roseiarcus fermentans TaxID=1473586 RepID=A0A366FDU6_9HYPH|nr:hypothetical protein [Roseiarcus fermentans]RBP11929.1 hypothetical protein DFR50_11536 [Roseiarcus fermentans]
MNRIAVAAAFAAFAVAGCNAPAPQASAPPAPGSVAVTPQGFQMPEGGDCRAEIARYRAVQDNDLAMGHVAQSVYAQIKREIAAAETACAAGRDGEAKAMIAASEQRHGYPTGI